jgi:hypothetical protein
MTCSLRLILSQQSEGEVPHVNGPRLVPRHAAPFSRNLGHSSSLLQATRTSRPSSHLPSCPHCSPSPSAGVQRETLPWGGHRVSSRGMSQGIAPCVVSFGKRKRSEAKHSARDGIRRKRSCAVRVHEDQRQDDSSFFLSGWRSIRVVASGSVAIERPLGRHQEERMLFFSEARVGTFCVRSESPVRSSLLEMHARVSARCGARRLDWRDEDGEADRRIGGALCTVSLSHNTLHRLVDPSSSSAAGPTTPSWSVVHAGSSVFHCAHTESTQDCLGLAPTRAGEMVLHRSGELSFVAT